MGLSVGAVVGDGVGLDVGDALGDADIAFVVPNERNFACIEEHLSRYSCVSTS